MPYQWVWVLKSVPTHTGGARRVYLNPGNNIFFGVWVHFCVPNHMHYTDPVGSIWRWLNKFLHSFPNRKKPFQNSSAVGPHQIHKSFGIAPWYSCRPSPSEDITYNFITKLMMAFCELMYSNVGWIFIIVNIQNTSPQSCLCGEEGPPYCPPLGPHPIPHEKRCKKHSHSSISLIICSLSPTAVPPSSGSLFRCWRRRLSPRPRSLPRILTHKL